MLRTATSVRAITRSDLTDALSIVDRTPAMDVFVGSRIHASQISGGGLGGELWGYYEGDALTSLCYSGANLVPVAATPRATRLFADLALRKGRKCSSLVGEAATIDTMWDVLSRDWGPPRGIRRRQPVMAIDRLPAVTADNRVRSLEPHEIDIFLPAAISMFIEEVGYSPIGNDGGANYRARVAELIGAGRVFAIMDGGQVIFKAEIGAQTPYACQLQGVWVRPEYRGRGLSVGGVAAVVERAISEIAPVVSLYVNDFNLPAIRAYQRVGFSEIGQFATVMF